MLTLTRLVGERILIGDDIVIEVRSILDGKQVRISIDAPRQVPIRRAEIVDAVTRANLEAAKSPADPGTLGRSIDRLGTAVTQQDRSTTTGTSRTPPGAEPTGSSPGAGPPATGAAGD